MKKITENKVIILVSFLSIVAFPLSSFAQKEENETPAEVTSLEQLILKVQEEALYDTEENRQRIAKFIAEKDTQQEREKDVNGKILRLVIQKRGQIYPKNFK